MSEFTEMKTYIAAVEAGSMSAAAERLGIGISGVSRRLGDLESRLGVRLANRTARGISPTPAGTEYYNRALRILSDLVETNMIVSGQSSEDSGTIRIAVPLSYGHHILSPIISDYLNSRPNLHLDIHLSDRRVDIAEEGFDLAIRIGQPEDSSLIGKKLSNVRHVCAASPSFWDCHGRPKHPRDLKGLRAISYRLGGQPSKWKFANHAGKSGSVAVSSQIIVNNGDFAVSAAIRGLGIVLEPDFICADAIKQGQLEPVLEDTIWYEMSVYAMWPPGRPLPMRVRKFIDVLARSIQ